MRRPVVAANWKMHGRLAMVREYPAGLRDSDGLPDDAELVLCPPVAYLSELASGLGTTHVALGAQDCSTENEDGAFTGEVSARMLADVGCRFVIVGHSERRRRFEEGDALVADKFAAARAAGLTPILCVGESAAQRDAGQAEETVAAQLEAVIERTGAAEFESALLAYEPVWAIGTGRAATPEMAQTMHAVLRKVLGSHDSDVAGKVRMLYGGSVKPANAAALFVQPDIDGALVGGASLVPKDLLAIAAAAAAGMN